MKESDAVFLPHTAGRYQVKRFRKATVRSAACIDGNINIHCALVPNR